MVGDIVLGKSAIYIVTNNGIEQVSLLDLFNYYRDKIFICPRLKTPDIYSELSADDFINLVDKAYNFKVKAINNLAIVHSGQAVRLLVPKVNTRINIYRLESNGILYSQVMDNPKISRHLNNPKALQKFTNIEQQRDTRNNSLFEGIIGLVDGAASIHAKAPNKVNKIQGSDSPSVIAGLARLNKEIGDTPWLVNKLFNDAKNWLESIKNSDIQALQVGDKAKLFEKRCLILKQAFIEQQKRLNIVLLNQAKNNIIVYNKPLHDSPELLNEVRNKTLGTEYTLDYIENLIEEAVQPFKHGDIVLQGDKYFVIDKKSSPVKLVRITEDKLKAIYDIEIHKNDKDSNKVLVIKDEEEVVLDLADMKVNILRLRKQPDNKVKLLGRYVCGALIDLYSGMEQQKFISVLYCRTTHNDSINLRRYNRLLLRNGFTVEQVLAVDRLLSIQPPRIEFETATGEDHRYFDFVRVIWPLAPKGVSIEQSERAELLNRVKESSRAFQIITLDIISKNNRFVKQGLGFNYYSLNGTLTNNCFLVYTLSLKESLVQS